MTLLQLMLMLAAAVLIGGVAFLLAVDADLRRLQLMAFHVLTEARPTGPKASDTELERLPVPVRRWLQTAGIADNPAPASVRLRQEGKLRLGSGKLWLPFDAQQYFSVDPPAFLWTVRARLSGVPLLSGFDSLIDGHGRLQMRLGHCIRLIDAQGDNLDQGELLRYLSETIWFPAAALSKYIDWTPVDDRTAMATIRLGEVQASAVFHFSAEGRPEKLTARRCMGTAADASLADWETRSTDYADFQPGRGFATVQLPSAGRALWHTSSGELPYIDLRVSEIEYNPAAIY